MRPRIEIRAGVPPSGGLREDRVNAELQHHSPFPQIGYSLVKDPLFEGRRRRPVIGDIAVGIAHVARAGFEPAVT